MCTSSVSFQAFSKSLKHTLVVICFMCIITIMFIPTLYTLHESKDCGLSPLEGPTALRTLEVLIHQKEAN